MTSGGNVEVYMSEPRIRAATAADVPAVAEIVDQAYRHYIARMGKPPGPMLDDYAARVSQGLSVEDVRVRILGDVAIIHARTSYTTADGEQRNGRYTDAWARRDGRWLAVSAHVTR
jgi:hypothetical protein